MNWLQYTILFSALFFTDWAFGQDKLKESMNRGEQIYMVQCIACHMGNGEGVTGAFPPLAKSDYLLSNIPRAAQNILSGVNGEITVNGVKYYGSMPAHNLTVKELTDVLNYVTNSWGNKLGLIEEKTIAEAVE